MERIHRAQIFAKFIEIQNRYTISLNDTGILDKVKNISCQLNVLGMHSVGYVSLL